MEQKDLRTKLPELGFSYDRNNEFNRDEYENNNYCDKHLKIYVDKNTTRMEWLIGIAAYRKNYRTYVELKQETNIANMIDCFIKTIKETYKI